MVCVTNLPVRTSAAALEHHDVVGVALVVRKHGRVQVGACATGLVRDHVARVESPCLEVRARVQRKGRAHMPTKLAVPNGVRVERFVAACVNEKRARDTSSVYLTPYKIECARLKSRWGAGLRAGKTCSARPAGSTRRRTRKPRPRAR